MKNRIYGLGLLAFVLGFCVQAIADDSIFSAKVYTAKLADAERVSLSQVIESPVYQANESEILAAAEHQADAMYADGALTKSQVTAIKGWFKELPFHRVLDLEVSFFSGIPDMFSVCLEGNPSQYFSIEACAGSIVFISSLSVNVKSRFLHYINIEKEAPSNGGAAKYHGNEFSVGPGIGFRRMSIFGFDTGGGTASGLDAMLSVEWVHWFSKYFGFTLQLDGGVIYAFDLSTNASVRSVLPLAKLSIGVAF